MSDDVFAALRKLLVILIAGATLNLSGANLFAQPASGGSLRVTVVDQTGAVIVGATVTVAAADEATKTAAIAPVRTSDTGVAIVAALTPGRYTVQVEFPGFEKRLLTDVRVRNGENRQVAVKHVAEDADLLLVVGSDNSSNSNRLVEVARNLGRPSHLIENFRAIAPEWLEEVRTLH